MLMNFCDPCLLSEAKCNTVSNEGNEIANLTNGTDKGFIAYYAVRPPVHIDLKFVCKIQLSHVIIWPSVGAQKSTGLKLSVKSCYNAAEYKDVVTVFLKPEETGVFLYRNDANYTNTVKPQNFAERYIQLSKFPTINAIDNLRFTIVKTENSVPAIKRIEVWGKVSRTCDETTKRTLETLWNRRYNIQANNLSQNITDKYQTDDNKELHEKNENEVEEILDIPEEFLDPITCEIMIRPVVLPSGKIIDQSTLEKHEKTESAWGRKLSDPFTGLVLNEKRVVVPATALKERIDKFLLANSDNDEIKRMPRVLGSKQKRPSFSSEVIIKRRIHEIASTSNQEMKKTKTETNVQSVQKTHNLPFTMLRKQSTSKLVPKIVTRKKVDKAKDEQDDLSINKSRKIRCDNVVIDCHCCTDKILYKLPCKHVICRKIVLSNVDKCSICNATYSSSDPVRIYV